MIWLWLLPMVLVVALILTVCFWGLNYHDDWLGLVLFTLSCAFGLVVIIVGIRQIDHNLSSSICTQYGVNTNREVAFFDNSYFSYDCYVRYNNEWIPKDNIHQVIINERDTRVLP